MTTEAMVWLLACVVIVLIVAVVFASVLVYKTSADAIRSIRAEHDANREYTDGLVDRIVSGDYQTYKAYEMMGDRNELNKKAAEADTFTEVIVGSDRGGFGSRLGLTGFGPIGSEELLLKEADDAGR